MGLQAGRLLGLLGQEVFNQSLEANAGGGRLYLKSAKNILGDVNKLAVDCFRSRSVVFHNSLILSRKDISYIRKIQIPPPIHYNITPRAAVYKSLIAISEVYDRHCRSPVYSFDE